MRRFFIVMISDMLEIRRKSMKFLFINTITLIRLPLAIVSMWYMINQHWFAAWISFLACISTDVIDGYLARRLKAETKFGTIADLASDIAIYWVYIPGIYLYSQWHSNWCQQYLFPLRVLGILLTAAVMVIAWIAVSPSGKLFKNWYIQKGNFWLGVIPVGIIGLWISWHAGTWALTITTIYGVSAIAFNTDKIKKFI